MTAETPTGPRALVTRSQELLAAGEVAQAADLLHERVGYANVSLSTVRGRERVRGLRSSPRATKKPSRRSESARAVLLADRAR